MSRRPAPRTARVRRDDAGFSVLEVVVAIVIVTIVMTSLATFFVSSGNATDYQSQHQTAAQVAQSAMDKARSLSGVNPLHNRDKTTSDAQWIAGKDTSSSAKYPGVAPYLANLGEAYDTTSGLATNSGYTAPLPTNGNPVTLGGSVYTQNWFLGYCLRQSSGACTAGTSGTANSTYLQVVVDVTWTNKACPNLCSYTTVGTVSQTKDPVFDQSQGAPRPRITNPGNQSTEVGQPVNLSIPVSGGTAPLTWTAPTLPDGLTWNAGTSPASIQGSATTVTSTPFKVVLQVTDTFGYVSTAAFTWTVTPGPTIANLDDRSGDFTGTAVSFTATATGGTSPYNWSQTTGLPPGVTISGTGATATISGTPTRAGSYPVSVKVVDKYGGSDTETFTWTIRIGMTAGTHDCTGPTNGKYYCYWNLSVSGTGPFTWTSDNPSVTITTSNGTLNAKFEIYYSARGTYTVNSTATQTNGGATRTAVATNYCGTAP